MKKALSIVLVLCMALTVLVGCGGGSSSAAASTPASTAGSTPASTPAAAGDVTEITYWSMWSQTEPQGKVIDEAAKAYEAQTGIHVNIEWKGRDISTVIQAALDAKEGIDLFDEDFQRVATQYNKSLADLEDMAKAADYESYAVAALPAAIRDWAGSLVAIPYQPYTSGVFYTKSSFEAAGIEKEPATWDEFMEVCEKLKNAGYTALAQDDAYVVYTYGFLLGRLIGQDGVKELVNNGGWADSAEAKQAAQYVVDMREKGYLSETCPDAYPNGENELGMGLASMVVNASWVPGEITNNMSEGGVELEEEWGMFNFPDLGGKDPATVANIGAQAFAIPDYSEKKQAAFDFIMMITSGEYDQKMALESNGIPADTRNTEWPEMIANVRDAFNAQTGVYEWNTGLNDNADLKDSIKENIAKLFEGGLNAQGFIDATDALYK